jgi:hypothetical protein
MQIDKIYNKKEQIVLFDSIKKMYEETGIRLYNKPFKAPHIIFWNLRSTNGFPSLSNDTNCSMISGYNPSILNQFYEKGLTTFKTITPWNILIEQLNNIRYDILQKRFEQWLQ